ncbi:MAG: trypsin-like peptidase domain-containing protein [Deltaproteobacteria bacterium]|nr:trypsin-like peptidase domain-containing protein [Deltaproteobacteria bacterium]
MRPFALVLALALSHCTDAGVSVPTWGEAPLVYGRDDRQEYYQLTSPHERRLADATAVIVSGSALTATPRGYSLDVSDIYGDTYSLCADEPFRTQPDPGGCTAFAVGTNLVATAGHCVSFGECASTWFVFGFRLDTPNVVRSEFGTQDVYRCASVVARTYTDTDDWAVVRVDRVIKGRPLLRMRRSGAAPVGTPLVVAGHPAGIPLKVAANAAVMNANEPNYFQANLDTYGGNSGSPVMNATTGLIEGILVRGNEDFTFDTRRDCYRSNVCPDAGCPGWEDVSRTTRFVAFVPDLPECSSAADCDDGEACNGAELCVDGSCRAGAPVSCKDRNACTRDACNMVAGQAVCSNVPTSCDDQLPCTIDSCDPVSGCAHDPIVCPSGEVCVVGQCRPDVDASHCRVSRAQCTRHADCCSARCNARTGRCL